MYKTGRMLNITKFSVLAVIALTVACGKTEVKTSNAVLLNNAPDTNAYKDELASLLEKADPATLEYYFDHYVQKDNTDYLYINIEGAVEATAVVTVREWDDQLKTIHKFKGKGYGGAEFKNLKLEVERDSANTSFVYKGMDVISD
jgi:hypothetical protein